MNTVSRFICREWFPILACVIIIVAIMPRSNYRVSNVYSKGSVSVILVAQEQPNELEVLARELETLRWSHHGGRMCYQFAIMVDEQGSYVVLGGSEYDRALVVSNKPEEVIGWLHAVEDLKCNTIHM